jgi:hypothetical protein
MDLHARNRSLTHPGDRAAIPEGGDAHEPVGGLFQVSPPYR